MTSFLRGAIPALCLAVFSLALSGCSWFKEDIPMFTVSTDFSVNVASVDERWPEDSTKLPALQQEVLREKGNPSHVHLWWSKDGRVMVPKSEAYGDKTAAEANFNPKKVSWIYIDKKEEVFFHAKPTARYEVKPLPDMIKVLIEVGDPDRPMYTIRDGVRVETWRYLKIGRIYDFVDGKLIRVDNKTLPPVPGYKGF